MKFSDAFTIAATAAQSSNDLGGQDVRLIRDLLGRITFLVNGKLEDLSPEQRSIIQQASHSLAEFAGASPILSFDGQVSATALVNSSSWEAISTGNGGRTVQVLDRQISGEDWSVTSEKKSDSGRAKRVVFFSIKGGVGRSTALTVLASELARLGKKVLLIDLDLESPGLSALLLPAANRPESGIVDWLIADALGTEGSLGQITAFSPVGDALDGEIKVASSMGSSDSDYLSQLVRIYSDVPTQYSSGRLSDKLEKLVSYLEAQESPDLILIDSRGGLHELAAVSLGRLADVALLFCQNSQQSWDGYRALFDHWRDRPNVSRYIRSHLKMVYAMFPDANQSSALADFRQKSWDLFRERLYDEIPADDKSGGMDLFSFDEGDPDSPHSPLIVRWNSRFLEYDPRISVADGGLSSSDIEITFGPFIKGVLAMIGFEGT